MGYHTGIVSAKDLFATIIARITQTQPEASAPYWKEESSIASDGVFTSTGATGSDRIVLTFKEGIPGHYFIYGYAKDYKPGAVNTAGTFTSLQEQNAMYYSAVQNVETRVVYHLSVTADRVIIHVQGDKLITQWMNPLIFLGIPIRYDLSDKLCIAKIASEGATGANICPIIEDSIGGVHRSYLWKFVESTSNPSWGGKYFVETLHFSYGAEGLRGELDGIFGIHDGGLVDGDQIDVNGKKYLVIIRRTNGTNNFPRTALLMRMA